MLLLGHEHVMKIPENIMSWVLVLLGLILIYVGVFCSKEIKAHLVGYTCLP